MTTFITTLAAVGVGAVLTTSAFAQSAREVRGASPYVVIETEPAPKLIVDPPLPGKGGHFVAWEEPELFAAELRAAFRSLR